MHSSSILARSPVRDFDYVNDAMASDSYGVGDLRLIV